MTRLRSLEIYPLRIMRDLAQLSFLGIPTRPGTTRPLFDLLERHGVPLRFVIEGCAGAEHRDLVICIDGDTFDRVESEITEVESRMQPKQVVLQRPVAIIRVLGPHFDIRPGASALLFSALSGSGVKLLSNSTTITSSLCVISDDQVDEATRAIARVFELPEDRE